MTNLDSIQASVCPQLKSINNWMLDQVGQDPNFTAQALTGGVLIVITAALLKHHPKLGLAAAAIAGLGLPVSVGAESLLCGRLSGDFFEAADLTLSGVPERLFNSVYGYFFGNNTASAA